MKQSGKKLLFALTLLLATVTQASFTALSQSGAASGVAPYTLREDFQHDSLGQFASYPPAQDVGYEPSLTPTTDFDAPGGRALMRVWKPNRAGALRFGFIRQTFLVMSEGAKLEFAYRLNHAAPNDNLEIGVAGADGCRYVKRIPASTKGWNKAEIPLSEFRCANGQALKTGVGIEAVYIVADLKRADADIAYRFIIDDVALSAGRIEAEAKAIALRAPSAGVHPHLYFSASDRAKLIERARQPRFAKLWEHLQTAAKNTRGTGDLAHGGAVFEMLDKEYLLPSLLGYFGAMNQARARIAHNALVAYLNDDAKARKSAILAMLDVARWSRWEPPWFTAHGQHTYYPAGQLAAEVAFGYDLLYEHLTESERALVRRALIEKSIIPTFKEYVADNRIMANTSNWIAHTVGGALIAAAAIAGDVKAAEANGRFEIYLNGLLRKFEGHLAASYLPDGSYGEGISYQEFDLETTALALVALDRVFGIDWRQRSRVIESLAFPLYTLARPTSASLDMGDSHPPSGRTIAPLIAQAKDPTLRWFYDQFPHSEIRDFLFFDDSIKPQAPQLPTSRIFRDKGNAVFRTGWGADDSVFLFRAGPNFNHNHADQGSFLLTAFGEPLVTEAGWSHYYNDPYYATFFTQAIGHNAVLVDGDPESQTIADTPRFAALNAYPRITDAITSEFYDAVGSDLTPVYQDRLSRYTRRVVFVKPHYFVVFDDLAAAGGPAKFDWLLHLPDRSRIAASSDLAVYRGDQAALAVKSLAPAAVAVRDGRLPYATFATSTPKTVPPRPAFLDLQTTMPASAARFLVALAPARTSEAARELANQMTAISGAGFTGVRAERGAERDLVMFRIGAANETLRYEDYATDAAAWTVTQSGARLKLFAAQQARSFARAGRRMFASDAAVSLAASYSENVIEAVCDTATATALRLFTSARPSRVLIDGREAAMSFNQADAAISLTVPAGRRQLKIELR
ncbi:MAG: heparinase II/III domain-containing protein [Blastocatellia bacterium]